MKLYVLVRRDLTTSQRAVQAGHVVAQYLLDCPNTSWSNGTLIYLGIKNEHQLNTWEYKLKDLNINYSKFNEPDINNQITAIATLGNDKLFKNLRLL